MSLTNPVVAIFKLMYNFLWIDSKVQNCFGAPIEDERFNIESVYRSFAKSVLQDWYAHILLDGYGKVVHTFTLGQRWFMVNVVFDPETSKYRVFTKVSGELLSEEEERLLDFFEWYLSVSLTVAHDIDRKSGYTNRVDIYQRRNDNWCVGKNRIIAPI